MGVPPTSRILNSMIQAPLWLPNTVFSGKTTGNGRHLCQAGSRYFQFSTPSSTCASGSMTTIA